jgi:mannose-6-phosphate isomerase-like protein (cupin superfamily)
MIIATPDSIPGEDGSASHGGKGEYFVRTLLDDVPRSAFKYIRDLTLYPGSSVGEHLHEDDEEIYFVISGIGVMVVDGEERIVGPGTVVLTKSGSRHGLKNGGTEDLRIFVACAYERADLRAVQS